MKEKLRYAGLILGSGLLYMVVPLLMVRWWV